jgi:hypothetical protein
VPKSASVSWPTPELLVWPAGIVLLAALSHRSRSRANAVSYTPRLATDGMIVATSVALDD